MSGSTSVSGSEYDCGAMTVARAAVSSTMGVRRMRGLLGLGEPKSAASHALAGVSAQVREPQFDLALGRFDRVRPVHDVLHGRQPPVATEIAPDRARRGRRGLGG